MPLILLFSARRMGESWGGIDPRYANFKDFLIKLPGSLLPVFNDHHTGLSAVLATPTLLCTVVAIPSTPTLSQCLPRSKLLSVSVPRVGASAPPVGAVHASPPVVRSAAVLRHTPLPVRSTWLPQLTASLVETTCNAVHHVPTFTPVTTVAY